jgi:hypothetical protein
MEARDNPFTPLFDTTNKQRQNTIPILNITTNPVFATGEKIELIKKAQQPKIKVIDTPHIAVSTPTKKSVLPPVKSTIVQPIMIKTTEVKPLTKPKQKKKVIKKKRVYHDIYQNYFLKITTNDKNIKIITKDNLIQKNLYKSPRRLALDFQRLQYFHTKTIALKNPFAKKLKVGSHHDFYRITLLLKTDKHVKVRKKPYGYLLLLN